MKRISLNSGLSELHNALKLLRLRWEETKPLWADEVRADFEENTWEPLDDQVVAAVRSVERLDRVLGDMQQDCG